MMTKNKKSKTKEKKMTAVVAPRQSRRVGVVNYERNASIRLTKDEGELLDAAGVALNVSNSEVLRFFLRKYGPEYLVGMAEHDGDSEVQPGA